MIILLFLFKNNFFWRSFILYETPNDWTLGRFFNSGHVRLLWPRHPQQEQFVIIQIMDFKWRWVKWGWVKWGWIKWGWVKWFFCFAQGVKSNINYYFVVSILFSPLILFTLEKIFLGTFLQKTWLRFELNIKHPLCSSFVVFFCFFVFFVFFVFLFFFKAMMLNVWMPFSYNLLVSPFDPLILLHLVVK